MSSSPIIWIGMDVHKDQVMLAVFEGRRLRVLEHAPEARRGHRLSEWDRAAWISSLKASWVPRSA